MKFAYSFDVASIDDVWTPLPIIASNLKKPIMNNYPSLPIESLHGFPTLKNVLNDLIELYISRINSENLIIR